MSSAGSASTPRRSGTGSIVWARAVQSRDPGWLSDDVCILERAGNGDRGTDYGHGSVYWVLGGGINGGRVVGEQMKIDQASLVQNRDYPVLTDYRAMFAGLFQRLYGLDGVSVQRTFPGVHPAELGLV